MPTHQHRTRVPSRAQRAMISRGRSRNGGSDGDARFAPPSLCPYSRRSGSRLSRLRVCRAIRLYLRRSPRLPLSRQSHAPAAAGCRIWRGGADLTGAPFHTAATTRTCFACDARRWLHTDTRRSHNTRPSMSDRARTRPRSSAMSKECSASRKRSRLVPSSANRSTICPSLRLTSTTS